MIKRIGPMASTLSRVGNAVAPKATVRPGEWHRRVKQKKADAMEYQEVFHRVGLLTNSPPGKSRDAF